MWFLCLPNLQVYKMLSVDPNIESSRRHDFSGRSQSSRACGSTVGPLMVLISPPTPQVSQRVPGPLLEEQQPPKSMCSTLRPVSPASQPNHTHYAYPEPLSQVLLCQVSPRHTWAEAFLSHQPLLVLSLNFSLHTVWITFILADFPVRGRVSLFSGFCLHIGCLKHPSLLLNTPVCCGNKSTHSFPSTFPFLPWAEDPSMAGSQERCTAHSKCPMFVVPSAASKVAFL